MRQDQERREEGDAARREPRLSSFSNEVAAHTRDSQEKIRTIVTRAKLYRQIRESRTQNSMPIPHTNNNRENINLKNPAHSNNELSKLSGVI